MGRLRCFRRGEVTCWLGFREALVIEGVPSSQASSTFEASPHDYLVRFEGVCSFRLSKRWCAFRDGDEHRGGAMPATHMAVGVSWSGHTIIPGGTCFSDEIVWVFEHHVIH